MYIIVQMQCYRLVYFFKEIQYIYYFMKWKKYYIFKKGGGELEVVYVLEFVELVYIILDNRDFFFIVIWEFFIL